MGLLFTEELPGYTVEMVYWANSGYDLFYLYHHFANAVTMPTETDETDSTTKSTEIKTNPERKGYINPDAHDNIRTANEIVLVVYDDMNDAREHLTFRGTLDLKGWFDAKNIMDSSNWKISSETNFEVFEWDLKKNSWFMEITRSDSGCGSTGFLKFSCHVSETCLPYQWWAEDGTLDGRPCGIVYTKLTNPVEYENAYWASKITVFSLQYPAYNGKWLLNLRLSGGTQVRLLDLFLKGGFPSDGLTYRDKNLIQNFRDAKFIMIVLYDETGATEDTFIFDAATSGLTNWFTADNFLGDANSTLKFQFHDRHNFSFLNIGNNFDWIDDCDNAFGRLSVLSLPRRSDDYDKLCPFQRFWTARTGYTSILYSADKEGTFWNTGEVKYASMIEISTANINPWDETWKLVFKIPSHSGGTFSTYFLEGCNDNSCAPSLDGCYRHGNLMKQLEDASEISVRVYGNKDDVDNLVLELLFEGTGHHTDWFHEDRFLNSSTHPNLEESNAATFAYSIDGKYFYVGQEVTQNLDCAVVKTWLYILQNSNSCGDTFSQQDGSAYPQIRFARGSSNGQPRLLENLDVADRFEIYVR